MQQPLTYVENPEHWSSVSELVHKSPWKCMWTPKSSFQGARSKPCGVSLERGALLDCSSSSLEPVLRSFLTMYRWKSRMLRINFDVWNNTLSCILFQAGIANPNYCECSQWFWSRLTRKFVFILQQWNMWSFMLAAHCHSACVNMKGGKGSASQHSTFMSRDTQMYILSHLQGLQLVSLWWKS